MDEDVCWPVDDLVVAAADVLAPAQGVKRAFEPREQAYGSRRWSVGPLSMRRATSSFASAREKPGCYRGSVWTRTSCTCGWPPRMSVFQPAGQLAGVRQCHHVRRHLYWTRTQPGCRRRAVAAVPVAARRFAPRRACDALALLVVAPGPSSPGQAATGCSTLLRCACGRRRRRAARAAPPRSAAASCASPSGTSTANLRRARGATARSTTPL
jgi:hypothetical protein